MSNAAFDLTLQNVQRCAALFCQLKTTWPEFAMAPDIARAMGTARRYNEPALQKMRAGGVVLARTGRGGGYLLAPGMTHVSLLQIVEAIWGPQDYPLIRAWANLRPEDIAGRPKLKMVA